MKKKIFLLPPSGIEPLQSCEWQLMYCQIYHSDVSVIAQFQQLSHLEILDPAIAQFQQLSHLQWVRKVYAVRKFYAAILV
jgi:hypothetical protein